MKIELIRVRFGESLNYKYKPIKYCCDGLKDHPLILLTNKELMYESETEDFSNDEHIPIPPRMCITEKDCTYGIEYPETNNYPIKYCPFCGEKIDISVDGEIDATEEFDKLNEEKKELFKRRKETDSKKETLEIEKRMGELSQKIINFYALCSLDDFMND